MTRFAFYLNCNKYRLTTILCHNYYNYYNYHNYHNYHNYYNYYNYLKNHLSVMSSQMSTTVNTLVICGPSGSGKSTLLNRLMTELKDCFQFSVSHTTRSARKGEMDGKHYYFTDRQTFENMIEAKQLVEFAEFSGNYYGTSVFALEEVLRSGRIPVLDVEIQGVLNLQKTLLKAKYIFIKPPNIESLEKNLRNRGSEDEHSLQRRILRAIQDIKLADSGVFDRVIVNDNLDIAYQQLKEFVIHDIKQVQKLIKSKKSTSE